MLLTITVSHDRDESCNDYTLTRVVEIKSPTANLIQMSVRGIMDLWEQSYPFKGRKSHTPVVDVSLDDFVEVTDTITLTAEEANSLIARLGYEEQAGRLDDEDKKLLDRLERSN